MKIGEKIYSLIEIGTKTATAFLPNPISAAFNAIYDSIKEGVLEKRANKWKSEIVSRLEKLESNYENLISSELFATALIKTSELAIKTESDEKRKILADALINSYIENISEDKTLIFLQLIEKYTILHVQVIRYFNDEYMNQRYFEKDPPKIWSFVRRKFMDIDETYFNKIIKDLQNDYLIEEFFDSSVVEIMNHRFEMITPLGKEFYAFLKSPSHGKDE